MGASMKRNRIDRSLLLLAVCTVFSVSPLFAASATVGYIEYMEGETSITRAGSVLKNMDLGSPVENFDLLKTGPSGLIIIALDKSTGMGGTLTVKPKSVFAVKTELVKGVPSTEGDMIGGAVAVKAKKIAGTPNLRIRTSNTVMGVRGTEFEVTISVNDAILVACTDGRVVCAAESGEELEAFPGQLVQAKAGERLRSVPVAVSSVETFRNDWISEEISAFAASPLRALDQYAKNYRRLRDDFRKAYTPLASDPGLAAWIANEKKPGFVYRPNDITVMKQKSALAPKLMRVRGILFIFERVYYRLEEIRSLLSASDLRSRLDSGGTVADVYKVLAQEKSELEKRIAGYRNALRLFALYNEGREPIPGGSDSADGDFFDSTSDFFD
jgi:hypothetical protein